MGWRLRGDFIKLNLSQNFDKCHKKLCSLPCCISVVLHYLCGGTPGKICL